MKFFFQHQIVKSSSGLNYIPTTPQLNQPTSEEAAPGPQDEEEAEYESSTHGSWVMAPLWVETGEVQPYATFHQKRPRISMWPWLHGHQTTAAVAMRRTRRSHENIPRPFYDHSRFPDQSHGSWSRIISSGHLHLHLRHKGFVRSPAQRALYSLALLPI